MRNGIQTRSEWGGWLLKDEYIVYYRTEGGYREGVFENWGLFSHLIFSGVISFNIILLLGVVSSQGSREFPVVLWGVLTVLLPVVYHLFKSGKSREREIIIERVPVAEHERRERAHEEAEARIVARRQAERAAELAAREQENQRALALARQREEEQNRISRIRSGGAERLAAVRSLSPVLAPVGMPFVFEFEQPRGACFTPLGIFGLAYAQPSVGERPQMAGITPFLASRMGEDYRWSPRSVSLLSLDNQIIGNVDTRGGLMFTQANDLVGFVKDASGNIAYIKNFARGEELLTLGQDKAGDFYNGMASSAEIFGKLDLATRFLKGVYDEVITRGATSAGAGWL